MIYFCLIPFCSLSQTADYETDVQDFDKHSEDLLIDNWGNCYVKGIVPSGLPDVISDLGPSHDVAANHIRYKNFILSITPSSTEWVRKKADKNCQSHDPKDCYVLCLEKIEERVIDVELINENSSFHNSSKSDQEVEELLIYSGYLAWFPAFCPEQLEESIQVQVEDHLEDEGIFDQNIVVRASTTFSFSNKVAKQKKTIAHASEFISALNQYQLQNQLPVGKLNQATLEKMGIAWE